MMIGKVAMNHVICQVPDSYLKSLITATCHATLSLMPLLTSQFPCTTAITDRSNIHNHKTKLNPKLPLKLKILVKIKD